MVKFRKSVAAVLTLTLLPTWAVFAAVRGEKAAYVGGTVNSIPQGAQGTLNFDDPKVMRFLYEKGKIYELPYARIETLEFGQKVGRRVGSTIALGVTTLGIMALPMLFSKKKKHYLTIGFKGEDGGGGAAVFELSKNTVRVLLPALEARTGKKVVLEDGTAKQGKEKT